MSNVAKADRVVRHMETLLYRYQMPSWLTMPEIDRRRRDAKSKIDSTPRFHQPLNIPQWQVLLEEIGYHPLAARAFLVNCEKKTGLHAMRFLVTRTGTTQRANEVLRFLQQYAMMWLLEPSLSLCFGPTSFSDVPNNWKPSTFWGEEIWSNFQMDPFDLLNQRGKVIATGVLRLRITPGLMPHTVSPYPTEEEQSDKYLFGVVFQLKNPFYASADNLFRMSAVTTSRFDRIPTVPNTSSVLEPIVPSHLRNCDSYFSGCISGLSILQSGWTKFMERYAKLSKKIRIERGIDTPLKVVQMGVSRSLNTFEAMYTPPPPELFEPLVIGIR